MNRTAAIALGLALLGNALVRGAGPAVVDYAKEIKPLLRERCYSCHGALKQSNGLRLDTADLMKRGGKHGPAFIARRPEKSLLLAKVSATAISERMPPEGDALKPAQIELLRRWIAAGAPAPKDEKPEPSPSDHWAFKPVVRPPVPSTRNSKFETRNSLDAFINASLVREKITPLPPAEKPVLLRRVYLDLTGLPPTR